MSNNNLLEESSETISLYEAVDNGDIKTAKALIDELVSGDYPIKPNYSDGNYKTPLLCVAACNRDIEMVQLLLSYNPDTNLHDKITNKTALEIACSNNELEMVKLLLEAGAATYILDDNDFSPLGNAVCNNNLELVSVLLDGGADPNFGGRNCATALAMATQNRNLDIIKVLIEYGADPDLLSDSEILYLKSCCIVVENSISLCRESYLNDPYDVCEFFDKKIQEQDCSEV